MYNEETNYYDNEVSVMTNPGHLQDHQLPRAISAGATSERGPRSSVSSGCRALEEVLGRQCLLDAVLWKRSSVVSVFLMPCYGRGPRSSVSS